MRGDDATVGSESTSADTPEGLPEQHRELFVRLARAVQRCGLYPPDHPAVEPVVDRLLDRLRDVLEHEGPVSVGVGPRRLYTDGRASPDADARLRALARHLHDHQIGRLTFRPGLEAPELHAFLTAVREPVKGDTVPLARREEPDGWSSLVVEPIWYEQLELAEDEDEEDARGLGGGPSAELWMGLARAAGAMPDPEAEDEAAEEPVSVERIAAALEAGPDGRAFDREVLGQLLRIVRELEDARGTEGQPLRDRVARLVETLDRERLITMMDRAEPAEMRELLASAARQLRTGSVVELVDAASGSDRLDLSRWMLLLLGKLARHASDHPGLSGAEAESAFREDVRAIAGRLEEREDDLSGYYETLQRMSRWSGDESPGAAGVPDVSARRTLQMALEVDRMGEMGETALDELVETGDTATALELASGAPEDSGAAARLWDLLVEAGSLWELLATEEEIDLASVERLTRRMGADAAPALMNALTEAEDRSLRRRLFALLADLGPEVADHAVRRLDDDRWYVVRNMLSLLGRVADPASLDVDFRRFLDHPHPAVREETFRLLFRNGAHPGLVEKGLRDEAPRVIRTSLAVAGPDPGERLLPAVLDVLDAPPDERTERAAVHALARCADPEARERLVSRCRRESFFWRLLRGPLAAPDPVVAEAVAALASGPFDGETVEELVDAARRSDDERLRRAAEGQRP